MKEQIEKVLSAKNWTGHTLRELASYGRVGPNENTIKAWVRGTLGSVDLKDWSGPKDWSVHDALGERQRVEAGVAREVAILNDGPAVYDKNDEALPSNPNPKGATK